MVLMANKSSRVSQSCTWRIAKNSMSRTAAAVLSLVLVGCTHLRPIEPSMLLQSHPPSSIEVSVADGRSLVMREPRLTPPDKLTGLVNGGYDTLPLSGITDLRARQLAPVRTALLIGIPAAIATAIVVHELTRDHVSTRCVYEPTEGVYLC
jgi:hypothetical protein